MGFIAEITDYRGHIIKRLPEDFHNKAYGTRLKAELETEKQMTELGKTKKYAGRFLKYRVWFVSVPSWDLIH